jgi:polysaccharide lyase-like protein
MLLPSDFDFNLGGALPGLMGLADQSADCFLVRPSWQQGGAVGVTNFMTLNGKKFRQQTDAEGYSIPRGRWFQIDQEVVLNAADRENGTLRIWIDCALAVDRADFAYRARPDVAFAGVWPISTTPARTPSRRGPPLMQPYGCRRSRSAGNRLPPSTRTADRRSLPPWGPSERTTHARRGWVINRDANRRHLHSIHLNTTKKCAPIPLPMGNHAPRRSCKARIEWRAGRDCCLRDGHLRPPRFGSVPVALTTPP